MSNFAHYRTPDVPLVKSPDAALYNVIVYDTLTLCRVNVFAEKIMAEIFNLHAMEAAAHAAKLCCNGEDILLTATEDIAEQKVLEASNAMQDADPIAKLFLRTIRFEMQPAN